MDAYFDIANLRAYAKAGSHSNFQACTDMLRHNFNLRFRFKKDDLQKEKKQSLASIRILLKMFTRNRGNSESFIWGETYPPSNLSDAIYPTMTNEQLTSLFFIDDPNIKDMIHHGCLLFASEGNELQALTSLLIEGQAQPTKKYPIRLMTNWQVIENNISPCTDVIIIDPYLFAQSDTLYEYNSYKLIEILSKLNNHIVNVVIFTLKDNPFGMIERQLKERIGEKLHLTFVIIPESGKWKEHDRTIITNYKMYDSNPSFTYFDCNGENVCHGRWLHVNSHGDRDIYELSLRYIDELQQMIDERKTGLNTIIGDKQSNFLKF